jgi:hypothetical protein
VRETPVKVVEMGEDLGRGNLLGIQPYLRAKNFRNRQEFAAVLTAALHSAGERGLLNPGTIAVFPEYIGLFLYLADEFPWVYRAKTMEMAGIRALIDEKFWLAALGLKYPNGQRLAGIRSELMRVKARGAARHYQAVFSHLARQFGITIVAGSIPLPSPSVVSGRLEVSGHPWTDMENVTGVFAPDGSLFPELVRKQEPTRKEAASLRIKPSSGALPIFRTPMGRLGVLVCADSWHPSAWAGLDRPDFVAVPSAGFEADKWERPWGGPDAASGASFPHDAADVGVISEGEAWMKYALPLGVEQSGARAGVNVFLQGQLWEMTPGGHAIGVREGRAQAVPAGVGVTSLVSVWL